jgi:hypothetical protein
MSTSTPTLIAAGVTAAYLRDLTRRSAATTEPEARPAARRSHAHGTRRHAPAARRHDRPITRSA